MSENINHGHTIIKQPQPEAEISYPTPTWTDINADDLFSNTDTWLAWICCYTSSDAQHNKAIYNMGGDGSTTSTTGHNSKATSILIDLFNESVMPDSRDDERWAPVNDAGVSLLQRWLDQDTGEQPWCELGALCFGDVVVSAALDCMACFEECEECKAEKRSGIFRK
jgi:hypothetical protein